MKYVKWLIPLLLALGGFILIRFVYGHGFLGFMAVLLAMITSVYFLIDLLKDSHRMAAKVLRTIFTVFLGLGLAVCLLTEAVIIQASFGEADQKCQYIVVLGAKVDGTEPSVSLSDRIAAAYDYLTENPQVIAILSGGQGADEGISEAECMFRKLTAMGIDKDRLWLEDTSTSTWENLQNTLELIAYKTGTRPETIGLLSSEYHLFRASLFAKDCGVEAIGIPAKTSWFTLRINYFTREVAGVWHYMLLGGQYHD